MTTNQTIDGVPRELLEKIANGLYLRRFGIDWANELRALLDAPAAENPIPQYFVEACDQFDWTPEEALRFYADGKHFDTDHGRTRILCTGAIASHALKGMGEGYAAMKGVEPAAQPQCEPVAWIKPEVAATLRKDDCCYAFGSQNPKGSLIPLYAEQPAPVAVVMPDRAPGETE